MQSLINEIKAWFEKQAFGVCEWWGEKLSIPSAHIRMFFIYTTFLTVGSPIILYLTLAFWKKMRGWVTEQRRRSVWDL
jgi:phage shock protein C